MIAVSRRVSFLAADSAHADTLKRLRNAEQNLAIEIRNVGFLPEGELRNRFDGASQYDGRARTASIYSGVSLRLPNSPHISRPMACPPCAKPSETTTPPFVIGPRLVCSFAVPRL